MTYHHRSPDPSPSPATAAIVPQAIVSLMAAFRDFFTAPVWDHVLVLVTGAVLTTGKRTVSAVLRIMGLAEAADFALYHHVLSQAHWDSRIIARKLLCLILERLLSAGPVIIGIDDTIERR
jgi:DDE superfamily endonuclease